MPETRRRQVEEHLQDGENQHGCRSCDQNSYCF